MWRGGEVDTIFGFEKEADVQERCPGELHQLTQFN
jgi:hypothetical protein